MSQPSTPAPFLAYRPDIDGLRAVAVAAVIAFHISPEFLPGGFIGVDVFFVVSGYLITAHILDSLDRGTFTFAEFYIRRARRIFPALTVVLIACLAAGWYLFLPHEFDSLERHVVAGAAFLSNLLLLSEVDYFDFPAAQKPLLHLWSLGVEEQFYLVWPLMLWLAVKSRVSTFWIIVITLVGSLGLNLWLTPIDPPAAFYLPFTRFWQLMAGSLLAWLALSNRAPVHARAPSSFARAAPITGLLLIVGGCVFINPRMAYPGLWAVIPVLGAAAIIAAEPRGFVSRALSHRLAVGIGLISYPLYLWHWPLITFARITDLVPSNTLGRFILIATSMVCATATYFFVERKIRRRRPSPRLGIALSGGLAIVAVLSVAAIVLPLTPRNNVPGAGLVLEAIKDWRYPPRHFEVTTVAGHEVFERRSAHAGATLFIGDSLMEQYAPAIDQQLTIHAENVRSAIFITHGGCPPIPSMVRQSETRCQRWLNAVRELMHRSDVERFVVTAHWTHYLKEPDLTDKVASLAAFLRELVLLRPTTLILSAPTGPEFDPKRMFEGSRFGEIRYKNHIEAVPLKQVLSDQATARKLLMEVAARTGSTLIDPMPSLCDGGWCSVMTAGGKPLYKDGGHMRPFYVIERATYIVPTILMRP